jgi:hypothetical protein
MNEPERTLDEQLNLIAGAFGHASGRAAAFAGMIGWICGLAYHNWFAATGAHLSTFLHLLLIGAGVFVVPIVLGVVLGMIFNGLGIMPLLLRIGPALMAILCFIGAMFALDALA